MNLQNFFNVKNIIIYLIIINLIAFLSMLVDKKKAKYGRWRIPENTLFLYAILGGTVGSIIGMYTFRHKTHNPKFKIGMPALLILQILQHLEPNSFSPILKCLSCHMESVGNLFLCISFFLSISFYIFTKHL